jgi:hypothetical protein
LCRKYCPHERCDIYTIRIGSYSHHHRYHHQHIH